jgi:uncharacterized protein YfiM (DUF2279 family)
MRSSQRRARPCRRAAFAALLAAWLAAPAGAQEAPAEPEIDAYLMQHGWFTIDKLYHFGVSAVAASTLYAGGREVGLGRRPAAVVSVALVSAAGLIRELRSPHEDRLVSTTYLSRKDLVWNSVGIAVGIAVTDRVFARRRQPPGGGAAAGAARSAPGSGARAAPLARRYPGRRVAGRQ